MSPEQRIGVLEALLAKVRASAAERGISLPVEVVAGLARQHLRGSLGVSAPPPRLELDPISLADPGAYVSDGDEDATALLSEPRSSEAHDRMPSQPPHTNGSPVPAPEASRPLIRFEQEDAISGSEAPAAPSAPPQPRKFSFEDEITTTGDSVQIESLALAAASVVDPTPPPPPPTTRARQNSYIPSPSSRPPPGMPSHPSSSRPTRVSAPPLVLDDLDDLEPYGSSTSSFPPPPTEHYGTPHSAAETSREDVLIVSASSDDVEIVLDDSDVELAPGEPVVDEPSGERRIYDLMSGSSDLDDEAAEPATLPPAAMEPTSFGDRPTLEAATDTIPRPALLAPPPPLFSEPSPSDRPTLMEVEDEEVEEAAPASQRQPRDEERSIDDALEGVDPAIEPPPESGEVESNRYPMQPYATDARDEEPDRLTMPRVDHSRAGSEIGLVDPETADAPTPRPHAFFSEARDEREISAEVRSPGSVEVVRRPPVDVEPPIASFEGFAPRPAATFGDLLDAALSLGSSARSER